MGQNRLYERAGGAHPVTVVTVKIVDVIFARLERPPPILVIHVPANRVRQRPIEAAGRLPAQLPEARAVYRVADIVAGAVHDVLDQGAGAIESVENALDDLDVVPFVAATNVVRGPRLAAAEH